MRAIRLKWRAVQMNEGPCDECSYSTHRWVCYQCGHSVCHNCIWFDENSASYICMRCKKQRQSTAVAPVSARHIARISFSPSVLLHWLSNGTKHLTIESQLPPDAEFLGAWFDTATGTFVCHVEHPSFGPMCPGALIPDLGVVWVKTHDNPSV